MSGPAPAPGPARERLHEAVLRRLSDLEPAAGAAWLADHALLAVHRHPRLPPEVRDLLRPRLRQTAAHNLFMVTRFRDVVDALEGIPVCALKGIHLLGTVYRGDAESRVLGDLDLLVPEERLNEAVARLRTTGLEETAVSHRIRTVSPERVLTDGRTVVELHHRLAIKHLGRSAWEAVAPEPVPLHGRRVFALDRETALVHLVVHLVKHRPFSRLGWVEDVLRWIERGADGERAVERAREIGALTSFVAGVRALRRALGPLGLPAVPDLPPGAAGRLAVLLNERLVWRAPEGEPPLAREPGGATDRPGRTLSALLLADRMAHRARFLRAKLVEMWRR